MGKFTLKAIICTATCAVLVAVACAKQPQNTAVHCRVTRQFTVVLDAGHGGIDGGATGVTTGAHEDDINLDVTLRLARLLTAADVAVVLTRPDENSLCSDEQYTKKLDMRLRSEVIYAAKPDIVISIHMNSYPSAKVKGAQVFYYPDSLQGKILAGRLQNALLLVNPDNRRVIKEADFFLLRTYPGPSALIECGFLSCPEEEQLLLTEQYRQRLAYCIFCGITEYLALDADNPEIRLE